MDECGNGGKAVENWKTGAGGCGGMDMKEPRMTTPEQLVDALYRALQDSQQWIAKVAADHGDDYIAEGARKRLDRNYAVLAIVEPKLNSL